MQGTAYVTGSAAMNIGRPEWSVGMRARSLSANADIARARLRDARVLMRGASALTQRCWAGAKQTRPLGHERDRPRGRRADDSFGDAAGSDDQRAESLDLGHAAGVAPSTRLQAMTSSARAASHPTLQVLLCGSALVITSLTACSGPRSSWGAARRVAARAS